MTQSGLIVLIDATNPDFRANSVVLAEQFAHAGAVPEAFQTKEEFWRRALDLAGRVPFAVADGSLIAGQAMIDGLVRGGWTTNAALVVAGCNGPLLAQVAHRKVVSASSSFHEVTAPTHNQLGFVRVGNGRQAGEAVTQARDFDTTIPGNQLSSLITVALVRVGEQVAALAPAGLAFSANSGEEAAEFRSQVQAQDEEEVRFERAMRIDDGFYSTFVLRKFSRRLSIWAIKNGITPNQITLASLAIAAIAFALFASGNRVALVIGALLVQISLIVDCSDGEVARFTGASSALGAWLDAATDRIKEYGLYAGLAIGSLRTGNDIWKLAIIMLILQTVRHLADYNFASVQVARETSQAQHSLLSKTDGYTALSSSVLRTSANLNKNTKLRWAKKVLHMPIGERWLIISVGAAIGNQELVFQALIALGLVGLAYTSVGRVLRSRSWNHEISVSGCDVLERQLDSGPLTRALFIDQPHPLSGRLGWAAPSLMRFIEFFLIWALSNSTALAFAWIFASAFHHYDALYRSLNGHEIPSWINRMGLGWDGRVLLVLVMKVVALWALNLTFVIGAVYLFALFVVIASRDWVLSSTSSGQ
jgi:phosphatidylglycerophosphate synthase